MPDFDDNENEIETGDVALVFTVTGGGEVWRFTNSDGPLSQGDVEYAPGAVQMSNIISEAVKGDDNITITMARSTTLADRFFPNPTRTIFKISVRQVAHAQGRIIGGPLMFTGAIMSVSSSEDGTQMKLECTTQMGLLLRNGLRRRYQIQCPLLLFGHECRASKAASQFSANISVPDGAAANVGHVQIQFYGEDADQPHIWRGRDLSILSNRIFMVSGYLEFDGVTYEVTDVLTGQAAGRPNTFRLMIRTDQAQALRDAVNAADPSARMVLVTPGCDHTLSACQQIFLNGQNYGGQPFISPENPIHTVFVGM